VTILNICYVSSSKTEGRNGTINWKAHLRIALNAFVGQTFSFSVVVIGII
jgi:hypothetical protein